MRLIHRLTCAVSIAVFVAACGSSSSNPDGGTGNVVNVDPSMSTSTIASAFSTAAANSTIQMAAGTYHLNNSLNLAANNNITLKGAGAGQTILDFSTQAAGADGVVQSVPSGQTIKVTFQAFSVQDSAGDGIKVTGGNGVHFNGVNVSWPTRTTHGGYGIYPVQSKNVLVENCAVDGASDTGIYVGQSDTIVVKNNTLTNNVAGIEIENSSNAEVGPGNNAHDNTVGFLVFDLPNLPKVGGKNTLVHDNQFINNNHANFGDPSGTVALVPAGTGGAVLATSNVEVKNNTFSGNTGAAFSVISCFVAFTQAQCLPPPGGSATAGYSGFPTNVYAHDNTFSGNGANPLQGNTDTGHPSYQLASLLATGFLAGTGQWAGGAVSAVSYDGIFPTGTGGTAGNPANICSKNNGTIHFADMHFDQLVPPTTLLNATNVFDEAAFTSTCTATTVPPVTLTNI